MPSTLLVLLDGSALGESAVPWATCRARTAGYAIVLAQAVPWPLIATEGLSGTYASVPGAAAVRGERHAPG
jgi:hypothetical protein